MRVGRQGQQPDRGGGLRVSEIAVKTEQPTDVALPSNGNGLVAWAMEAKQANLIAQSLALTAFVPRSLRVIDKHGVENLAATASQITAAILTGKELGMEPMAALRSIDIIEGTPAMRAHALRGLVQSHGHEIWVEETTDTRAVVKGRRAGSERVLTSVWTIDRAKKLGLAGRQQWQKQPANMLVARATSEMARWIDADGLLGMPYSSEELSDGDSVPTPAVAVTEDETPAAKPKTRKMQRAQAPPPAPEPELEESAASEPEAVEAEPVAETEPEPTFDEQWPEPAPIGGEP